MTRIAVVMLVSLCGPARAECPVDVTALPPMGLVSAELSAFEPSLAVDPSRDGVEIDLGASAGTLVDAEHAALAASVGTQAALRRGSVAACVSADGRLADRIGGEMSATVAVPLWLTTAIQLGFIGDKELDVSLLARPEYLRAPLDRREFRTSFSFLDFTFRDSIDFGPNATMRITVAAIEIAISGAHQQTDMMALARRDEDFDVTMLRVSSETPRRRIIAGAFAASATQLASGPYAQSGLDLGIAQLDYASVGAGLNATLRGGLLSHDTDEPMANVDPNNACASHVEPCFVPAYRAEVGWKWNGGAGVQAAAARTGFFANDRTFAIEDRASVGGTWHRDLLDVKLGGFVARTRAYAYAGQAPALSGGGRLALARDLGRGFFASVQGEIVRGGYATALEPDPPTLSARVVAQLAWRFHSDREHPHVTGPPSLDPMNP